MAIVIKERKPVRTIEPVNPKGEPKFRDPATMTKEELTDPDFRLKQLMKEVGLSEGGVLSCSKCHHCR